MTDSDFADAEFQNTADIAQCNTDDPTSKVNADALTPDVCYLLYRCGMGRGNGHSESYNDPNII